MSNYLRFFISLGLILTYSQRGSAEIASVYTELSEKACTVVPASGEPGNEEDGLRCKGPSGYELSVYYGDARASISVISPDGTRHDLNFWDVITHYFSSLGPRVEWRVKKEGTTSTPVALIVRVNAHKNPDQSAKTTSYLAVAKITKEKICVTDRIKTTGNENVKARIAADASDGKDCLGTAPF